MNHHKIRKVIDIELGDFSRCQVKPENYGEDTLGGANETAVDSSNLDVSGIKNRKIDGERVYGSTCPNCSSTRMVRNGTCMVCLDCGSTTGCS